MINSLADVNTTSPFKLHCDKLCMDKDDKYDFRGDLTEISNRSVYEIKELHCCI